MKTIFVMRLLPALPLADDHTDWMYLRECDHEARDGRGNVVLTHDPKRAFRFIDRTAAMTFWQRQSVSKPFRPDGKPNRPLTAYHADIHPLEVDDANQ